MTLFQIHYGIALIGLLACCSFLQQAEASHYGILFSKTLAASATHGLHGHQLMLQYDPQCCYWRKFNLYFDGGVSRFWVENHTHNRALTIYSAAPVIRHTFKPRGQLTPYLEFSIGAAYLTKTRLDGKNLGIHFAFQDRIGFGALLYSNNGHEFSVGLHTVHYSNAHLSEHNSGITAPLVLDIAYRLL
jgi:lipid A 3-O-deacylase